MKTVKLALRIAAFLLLLAIVIYAIPGKLFGVNNAGNYARIKSFYNEKKGALDAVIIGASNVLAAGHWLAETGNRGK